jgi:hypothetical protein
LLLGVILCGLVLGWEQVATLIVSLVQGVVTVVLFVQGAR